MGRTSNKQGGARTSCKAVRHETGSAGGDARPISAVPLQQQRQTPSVRRIHHALQAYCSRWPRAFMVALSGAAQAATTSTTFGVSATVAANCIVTATPIAFGNYDGTAAGGRQPEPVGPLHQGPARTPSGWTAASATSFAPRKLRDNGGDTLEYNLFTDSSARHRVGQRHQRLGPWPAPAPAWACRRRCRTPIYARLLNSATNQLAPVGDLRRHGHGRGALLTLAGTCAWPIASSRSLSPRWRQPLWLPPASAGTFSISPLRVDLSRTTRRRRRSPCATRTTPRSWCRPRRCSGRRRTDRTSWIRPAT
ncbi:MAG: spore coat U domain-containing protein [Desulfobacterales bacterium]|nr:spore coat U domain-containing protein [Desulfobacterales bacterium]